MAGEGINYDNILVRFLNRIADAMVLSLITLICSIPIVTIGASLTAAYYTAMHGIKNGDGYVVRKFMKSFKQNLKQSTGLWLVFMVLFIVFGVDAWYWQQMYKNDAGGFMVKPLLVLSVVLLALTVMTFIFAFPLQAKFENSIKMQLKNAFILAIRYVPTTLIIVFTLAVVALFFSYQPVLAIVVFAMGGLGGILYFFSFLMLRCFKAFMPQERPADDEESL